MMQRQRIKDVFSTELGFFTEFERLYPNEYDLLFVGFDSDILNMAFVVNYGEKWVSPVVTLTDIEHITKMMKAIYYESWLKIKQTLDKSYDVTKPYNTQLTSSLERDFTSDIDSNIIDIEQVYGFDSTIGQDDTKNTSERTRNIDNHESNERVQTRIGNLGNRNISDDIRKEINVRDIKFLHIVLDNLEQELTLAIY